MSAITIQFAEARVRTEEWGRSDVHCPTCGCSGTLHQAGRVSAIFPGQQHFCLACNLFFLLDRARPERIGGPERERMAALRLVFEGSQSASMVAPGEPSTGDILAELRALRQDLLAIAADTRRLTAQTQRWDGDGATDPAQRADR